MNTIERAGIAGGIEEIYINDRTFVATHLTYTEIMDPVEQAQNQAAVEDELAAIFRDEYSEGQLSACHILDMTPIIDIMGIEAYQQAMEAWFEQTPEEQATTQRHNMQRFGRPTFQIMVMPGIDEAYFHDQVRNFSVNANVPLVAQTFEDALDMAATNLKLAHRL